jgi:hypothetical protein
MPELLVPVVYSPNRRLCIKHSVSYSFVSLVNTFVRSLLLNRIVTLGHKGMIVPSITLLFHLISRSRHNLAYAIDEALILPLHVVSFEIGNAL